MNAKASMRKPLGLCGESREICLDAAEKPWQETIQAAESIMTELSLVHLQLL